MAKRGANQAPAILAGQGYWVAVFGVLLLAVAYSGVQVVDAAAQTRALYQRLGELQRLENNLLEESSRLSLERSSISSLQQVEQVAQQQLDMEFPSHVEGIRP